VDIVYSRSEGLRVAGTMTTVQRFLLPAGEYTAGARLLPGMARAALGLPISEVTDRSIALADLWGTRGRDLESRLSSALSPSEIVALLTAALSPIPLSNGPVQRAINAIVRADGDVNLEVIASQANVSVRQFRRRCTEHTGLSPKQLCRVLRFRKALRLARRCSWAQTAAQCGYYEQAHLIRDFREFAGRSPTMSVFSNPYSAESATLGTYEAHPCADGG
jgi:AraC-like DNA-binding protein